jgi:hypothetical protein
MGRNKFVVWSVVAAALAVVIVLGAVGVVHVLSSRSNPTGSVASTVTPTASALPQTASPSAVASPSSTSFSCTSTGTTLTPAQPASPLSYATDIRTGSHEGYDRLTVEFKDGAPASMEVRSQTGTVFTLGASGQSIKLAGNNGILLILHGADGHSAYAGSRDLKTSYDGLAETRVVEDFEGVVQIALGVNGPACYHAATLDNPARLVIDVQTP